MINQKSIFIIVLSILASTSIIIAQETVLYDGKKIKVLIHEECIKVLNGEKQIIEKWDKDIGYDKNGKLYGLVYKKNDSIAKSSSIFDSVNQILYISIFDEFYRGRLIIINLKENIILRSPLGRIYLPSKTSIFYVDVVGENVILKSTERFEDDKFVVLYSVFKVESTRLVFCDDIILEKDIELLDDKLFGLIPDKCK